MTKARKIAPSSMGDPNDWTLEDLMTSPAGFRLSTATDVQRAVWRVIEGRPLGALAEHPRVILALGGKGATEVPLRLREPTSRPRKVYWLGGIRGGKTETIGGVGLRSTQIIDCRKCNVGDIPRFSILSLNLDLARVAFAEKIVGKIMASDLLKSLVLDEPTKEAILLRHPTGRPVEIKVVAASAAGNNLVARWSAGMAPDEAPRMHGEESAINLNDAIKAIGGRLLPGAQVLPVGAPNAPEGPVYDIVSTRWGLPGDDLVVVRTPAYDLNPVHWTPEECERMKNDPLECDAYITDVECEFAAAESAMYPPAQIERAKRLTPRDLPPQPRRYRYLAIMDPGTRGNAWTLGVFHEDEHQRLVMDLAREWVGSTAHPLDPREVFPEIQSLVSPYGLQRVQTDQLGYDFAAALASFYGLALVLRGWNASNKVTAFKALQRRLSTETIEIPDDKQVRADLVAVRQRPTAAGVTIYLPTIGGRHCDYGPIIAQAAAEYMPALVEEKQPRDPHADDEPDEDDSEPDHTRHWLDSA